MVRKYKKKSSRSSWTEGQMYLAVQEVLKDSTAVLSIAKKFRVPRSTLRRKAIEYGATLRDPDRKSDEQIQLSFKKDTSGFCKIFNEAQEAALLKYVIQMERCLMGLTPFDVRRLAFRFAEKLGIKHNFNATSGLAGVDWFRGFAKRHNLSLRKSEGTSKARACGFNKESVDEFFDIFIPVIVENNIKDENIYNCDGTPVQVNAKRNPTIVALRGQRQVGALTAQERGKTVTAELCMSATGKHMPPMLIFPKKNRNESYLKGAPPGAFAEFNESGWVDIPIFTRWFREFIKFSNASKDNPVALVLDGHVSHVRNLEVIDLANENGVHILCLPPHCTHKMQPLDTGFMNPLSKNYTKAISEYQRKEKEVPKMCDIFSLFGQAWSETIKNKELAAKAFKKTGLVPINRDIFKDSDFVNLDAALNVSSSGNSANSSSEIDEYSQVIHEIENPSADKNTANAAPAIVSSTGSNSPTQSNESLQDVLSQLKTVLTKLDRVLPNHLATSSESPNSESHDNLEMGIANLLDVRINDGASGSTSSTSHDAVNHSNVVAASKKPACRPRNKAFLVTDENHRQKLIEAQAKKKTKESKPRKRKNSEPLNDSTNKRGRQRKQIPAPTGNQNLGTPPQILNNLVLVPSQPPPQQVQVAQMTLTPPTTNFNQNHARNAGAVLNTPCPSDTLILDWNDAHNSVDFDHEIMTQLYPNLNASRFTV